MTPDQIRSHIDGRRFAPAMKAALRHALEGETYRQAADRAGIPDSFREVQKAAKTVPGLRVAHLRAWRDTCGSSFPPLWRHYLEGLDGEDDAA